MSEAHCGICWLPLKTLVTPVPYAAVEYCQCPQSLFEELRLRQQRLPTKAPDNG